MLVRIIEGAQPPGRDPLLDAMYRCRKQIFVDLRKWDVPVIDGMFEIDQFDTQAAVYCIAADGRGGHLGSIRLLPTQSPHILGTIFPELCDGDPPCGLDVWELTRACLAPRGDAAERRCIRTALTSAVVQYALRSGIRSYVCIADSAWLRQILALGWRCRSLGQPQRISGAITGALHIEISADTPALLARQCEHAATTRTTEHARAVCHV